MNPRTLLVALVALAAACRSQAPEPYALERPVVSRADEFYDVVAVGDRVWVVGYGGRIVHSPDRGRTWVAEGSGTERSLLGVTALDDHRLFAVGEAGLVLRSEDGGAHWQAVESGTKNDLLSVSRAGEMVWAVGANGTALISRDGGLHWEDRSIGEDVILNSAFFLDATSGWIVGEFGKALYATDGETWSAAQGTTEDMYLFDVAFRDRQKGWAVGLGGILLESDDGGRSWRKTESPATKDLYDLALGKDGARAASVGDEGTVVALGEESSWNPAEIPEVLVFLRGVTFADPLHAFAVGGRGTILGSEDGGKHWKKLS